VIYLKSVILNQFRWLGTYAELYNKRPRTDPTKAVKSKLGTEFHNTQSVQHLLVLYYALSDVLRTVHFLYKERSESRVPEVIKLKGEEITMLKTKGINSNQVP